MENLGFYKLNCGCKITVTIDNRGGYIENWSGDCGKGHLCEYLKGGTEAWENIAEFVDNTEITMDER